MCLGIPGQILEIIDAAQKLAIVDVGGVRRPVNLACIVDADHPVESCVGEWVLVHVGFAMNRIDPQEAQLTLELLAEMAEIQDELAVDEMTDAIGSSSSLLSPPATGVGSFPGN